METKNYLQLYGHNTEEEFQDTFEPKGVGGLHIMSSYPTPMTTGLRLSGMSAKQYLNLKFGAFNSKSKRRHAISPLNKKILFWDKVTQYRKGIVPHPITLYGLNKMSRDSRLCLLRTLRMMSHVRYGVMSPDERMRMNENKK